MPFRIVTYNIHKCQGFDRRVRPDRIIQVLQQIDADIICLQEIVHASNGPSHYDQAEQIAQAFPQHAWCFGSNRALYGGDYGNMTLTRLPLTHWHNHAITHAKREERGVLHTDHSLNGSAKPDIHVFNVHLGTGFMERRHQATRLLGEQILGHERLVGPRIVLGDFNEWIRGLTSKMLGEHFQTFRPRHALGFNRTYPSLLPIMTLDYCFYEPPLRLIRGELVRSPLALIASDHLPLVMDFELE